MSALPLALLGIGALTIAVSGATSGFGDPIPWLVVGLAIIGTAVGVARGIHWAFVAESIIAVILVLGVLFITLLSLAMVSATRAGLDGNMFGTPFGVLNGWASLALYAVGFVVGVWMLIASVYGRRQTRATTPRSAATPRFPYS
jgi:hypothetical protein